MMPTFPRSPLSFRTASFPQYGWKAPARHTQNSRNPFHAGFAFRCSFLPGMPSFGDFYFQAFDGSVSLPAAGYNYNSDWTPLLAGFSPAGMAASLAARS